MSLGQDFLSGFRTTAGLAADYKDRKRSAREREEDLALRKAREVVETKRYDDQVTRDATRRAEDMKIAEARMKFEVDTDARDFGFRRDRAATSDLRETAAMSRQARQDFGAEIDKARRDPFELDALTSEAQMRQLQIDAARLQNENYGKPRAVAPVETMEYDPITNQPISRKITGAPGALAGAAPGATMVYPKPPKQAVEMLLSDPQNLGPAFEQKYGPGSAGVYLR